MDLSATRNCHCLAARRRAREITRRYEEKLRPHGLRATQFSILAALAQTGPIPIGELADLLGLERTTLTRSANRLEDEGWVAEAESEDARVRRLKLTPAGREKVESAYPAWKEIQDEMDRQMEQLETEKPRQETQRCQQSTVEPDEKRNRHTSSRRGTMGRDTMQKITPNLWFDGDAEDAVTFYTSVFDDSTIGDVSYFDEATADASGQPAGSAMVVPFELEGQAFLALNGGPQFEFTPAVSFIVNCPTTDEVDELWTELSAGGEALMPLDSYPFSDRYGWTEDEYGVSWQLLHAEEIQERRIVPSLMFVGDRCGQAEEAIGFYTSVFEDSDVGDVARYGPDQAPDEEGTVMYADFTLCGQRFAAMDSAQAHEFTFNEAISFVVDCADQAEVDYFWNELTADGGEEGQCGWLKDRYGVSWQVVPTVLPKLVQGEDAEGSRRATEAMLQMRKIDIETLEEAYAG